MWVWKADKLWLTYDWLQLQNVLYTDFVSLSIAWTWRFVWVPANTASCCAHFRHNPATRGAPSALSASAACFSWCLRRTFTSSHSFWLTDRSFLKMEAKEEIWTHRSRKGAGKELSIALLRLKQQKKFKKDKKKSYLLATLASQSILTWGKWPEPPSFESGPGRSLSIVPKERQHFSELTMYCMYLE